MYVHVSVIFYMYMYAVVITSVYMYAVVIISMYMFVVVIISMYMYGGVCFLLLSCDVSRTHTGCQVPAVLLLPVATGDTYTVP